jgi:hypothetical protein
MDACNWHRYFSSVVFRFCRTTIRRFIFIFTQVFYAKLIQFTFTNTKPVIVNISEPLLFTSRPTIIFKCALLKNSQSSYEKFIKMFIN